MEHAFKQKVFYCDTDAYGVVWHGTYLRWLEMGRVFVCEKTGVKLSELENMDIVMPVAQLDIKYKQSARLDDEIIIETEISEYNKVSMTFNQRIINADTKKLYISATVKVVAIHKDGTLYRSLPEQVLNIVRLSGAKFTAPDLNNLNRITAGCL